MYRYLPRSRVALPLGVTLWCVLALTGFAVLIAYADRPGASASPPELWPEGDVIQRNHGSSTLVVLLHPRCPCSTATLGELERLLAQVRGGVRTYLVFGRPDHTNDDWARARLWERGGRIPGATRVIDPGGRLAGRFAATTSGHAVLYDQNGRLAYHGGLTVARGHEGAGLGRAALRDAIDGRAQGVGSAPVFGCPLVRADEDASGCADCARGAAP